MVVQEAWKIKNGLLTPTLKIKRDIIEARYLASVNLWYEKDADHLAVSAHKTGARHRYGFAAALTCENAGASTENPTLSFTFRSLPHSITGRLITLAAPSSAPLRFGNR